MRIIVTSLLLTALALPATLCAQQARPEVDVAVTYNPQWSNLTTGANFWTQGAGAELSATDEHGLGLVANVTRTHATHISPSGVNLTLLTATFGPRLTLWLPIHAHSQPRVMLFGEALVGVAHGSDSVFPSRQGAQASASSVAAQIGGGADIAMGRHLAIRLVQASWLRTQLPNATTNAQNNLLLGTGIVFRFP